MRMYSRSEGMKWALVHASLHLPHPSQAARSMTITHFLPTTPRRTDSPTRLGVTPWGVDATTKSPSAVGASVAAVSLPGDAFSATSSFERQLAVITPAAAPPATTNPDFRNCLRCIVMPACTCTMDAALETSGPVSPQVETAPCRSSTYARWARGNTIRRQPCGGATCDGGWRRCDSGWLTMDGTVTPPQLTEERLCAFLRLSGFMV